MSILGSWGGGIRTNDPIFSFVIKGAGQDLFLRDTSSCFGSNCVYDVLVRLAGKIILFGSEGVGYTFTHFIEEVARVPYRYFKNFSGIVVDEDGKKYQKSMDYYVRKLKENSLVCTQKQRALLRKNDNFKIVNFGGSCIVSIASRSYFFHTLNCLKNNPYGLLRDEENS